MLGNKFGGCQEYLRAVQVVLAPFLNPPRPLRRFLFVGIDATMKRGQHEAERFTLQDLDVLARFGDLRSQLSRQQKRDIPQVLEQLRHFILENRARLGALAAAAQDVIQARGLDVQGDWEDVYQLARDTAVKSDNKLRGFRALASITALWGHEVVNYYELHKQPVRQLELIRKCALDDPEFHWFPRLANMIMIRRHEQALSCNGVRGIELARETRLPLKLEDLELLGRFVDDKSGSSMKYGRELTPDSAHDPAELRRVHMWANCQDGEIVVHGQPLCELRKDGHHLRHLLQLDKCGLLSPRPLHLPMSDQTRSKGVLGKHDPATILEAAVNEGRPEKIQKVDGVKKNAATGKLIAASATAGVDADTITVRGITTDACQANGLGVHDSANGIRERDDVDTIGVVTAGRTRAAVHTVSGGNITASKADVSAGLEDVVDTYDATAGTHAEHIARTSDETTSERPAVGHETVASSEAGASAIEEDAIGGQSAGADQVDDVSSANRRPILPSGCSSEEFRQLLEWNALIQEVAAQAPQPVLPMWINPVRFASILDGPDTADEICDHDVQRLSWTEFRNLAAQGTNFNMPVIIKETFADGGDYSTATFADCLQRAYAGGTVDVRYLADEPQAVSTTTVVDTIRTSSGVVLPNAPNLLNLPNLSHAIAPGLTRLPRFRLLNFLTEASKAEYSRQSGKQTFLTPFDMGASEAFDIFGMQGAFSGAHMDFLGGTWLRNLFGVKLWMVVPERLMTDEDWQEFGREGNLWDPKGKARAIVLQPDDVFFMPPGVRVIHAVYTLKTCLMTGGMLWDELAIIPTLRVLRWVGEHQAATNEALPHQLASVLAQLQGPAQNVQRSREERAHLSEAIKDLQSLGCDCTPTACASRICSCYQQNRRCTPLCTLHLLEPLGSIHECMDEQEIDKSVTSVDEDESGDYR
jgi:hypothetical protein